ncbi:hypothetical protein ABGB19_18645 [Mycobacterium sp. B14F4]|uniref:hypothetical protein n=1 Tax=Mycobacterium sp. B14F4 TaxID=3153565 RepID=UPI00325C9260
MRAVVLRGGELEVRETADPSPSIGRLIGLDEDPEAIDQVRKGQGPPRVVVHPSAS